MAKPGLGKGLGDLMNGDQVAGKARGMGANAPSVPDPVLGRGLTTLVSAHRSNGEANGTSNGSSNPKAEEATGRKRELLPAWFFFAADILLLAFVVGIAFDAARPFDSGTILFCATAIGLGCMLSLIGVIRSVR